MSSCQAGWNSTSSIRWPYRSWVRSFGGFSLATRPHSCACSLPASRPRSASESRVAASAWRTQASASAASPAIGSCPTSGGTWLVTSCVDAHARHGTTPWHPIRRRRTCTRQRRGPETGECADLGRRQAGGPPRSSSTQQVHRHRDGSFPYRRPGARQPQRPRLAHRPAPATHRCTVPTGLSGVPPPGPAMPVIPTPTSAPNRDCGRRRRAPTATSGLTAPCSASSSAGTPTSCSLAEFA